MDYGTMVGESFEYAKEALMEKWIKWILLIIPFMTHGYSMQVFKAKNPAPEVNDWVSNFIDGVKLTIVGIIYFIPIIIIAFIFAFGAIIAVINGIVTGRSNRNNDWSCKRRPWIINLRDSFVNNPDYSTHKLIFDLPGRIAWRSIQYQCNTGINQ